MKEIKENATSLEIETILLTWLSSIVSNNFNLIVVDRNLFSKKLTGEYLEKLIELFTALKIQHITLITEEFQQETIEKIQKRANLSLDTEIKQSIEKSCWISLSGTGFQFSKPLIDIFQGEGGQVEYLTNKNLLEMLEEISN
ncbi:MAG: hypothetical protein LBV67_08575 [Streptococcaceae bacterium]|jgi:hypothetical protein|nr:hypothetical protein [Streptococcaceae bacterium]